jgi:hypothetical protein
MPVRQALWSLRGMSAIIRIYSPAIAQLQSSLLRSPTTEHNLLASVSDTNYYSCSCLRNTSATCLRLPWTARKVQCSSVSSPPTCFWV